MKTWLTVAEGAEYAGVSRDTIYAACERNEVQHARVGGRRSIRLRPAWIDAWLERHSRGGRQSPRIAVLASTIAAEAASCSDSRSDRGTPRADHDATATNRRPASRQEGAVHNGR